MDDFEINEVILKNVMVINTLVTYLMMASLDVMTWCGIFSITLGVMLNELGLEKLIRVKDLQWSDNGWSSNRGKQYTSWFVPHFVLL